ncbi:MAG TPA: peptidylprolyl isomerase [Actinomycetota bacterium]
MAAVVASAVVLSLGGFGLASLVSGLGKPLASASPRPSPRATPTAGVACGGTVPAAASVKKPQFTKPPKQTIDPKKTYTLKMETSCGEIDIRLDQKSAPHTANSLVFLAKQHFFDGLLFHRTVQNFVIQGGDPLTVKGNPASVFGTGGPGYKTVDTPTKGGRYPQGTMAMAKAGSEAPGTAGSQFFIVTGTGADSSLAPGGKPQYAIVGTVVKGLDVAVRIEHLPREKGQPDGRPAQDVYIVGVTAKVS